MLIHPYKMGSVSAKLLAKELGCLRTTRTSSRKNKIINWGSSNQQLRAAVNSPSAVLRSTNKVRTLEALRAAELPTPEWTTSRATAYGWYGEGHEVFCRTKIKSSGGDGIVVSSASSGQPLVDAPLYTLYCKNKEEYRVHVAGGDVIYIQQKRRRRDTEINNRVRSHAGGWVFCTGNVVCPEAVTSAAVQAVAALGLDFGAVDVGYRVVDNRAFIFEVNTAPGIEGSTVKAYANYFRKVV